MKLFYCLIGFILLQNKQVTYCQFADPLTVTAPVMPKTVQVDDKKQAYYELKLINKSDSAIKLVNLAIQFNDLAGKTYNINNKELSSRLSIAVKSKTLAPGDEATVYLEVPFPDGLKEVTSITHTLSYQYRNNNTVNHTRYQTRVSQQNPLTIASPLKQGYWAAVYDPSWPRGHRRVGFFFNDTSWIPGRFAIDFIRLNKFGQYATANKDSIKNWFGYGAEILAVADGVIAAAVDTFAESSIISGHPVYDSSRATGNYLSLKLHDSAFAFYEHLQSGSITVQPGDTVKVGQVLGRLGFTGQSTGPHLHFHIADRNTPLAAQGLPFHLKSFRNVGSYDNFTDFGVRVWKKIPAQSKGSKNPSRPASNTVIEFNE